MHFLLPACSLHGQITLLYVLFAPLLVVYLSKMRHRHGHWLGRMWMGEKGQFNVKNTHTLWPYDITCILDPNVFVFVALWESSSLYNRRRHRHGYCLCWLHTTRRWVETFLSRQEHTPTAVPLHVILLDELDLLVLNSGVCYRPRAHSCPAVVPVSLVY